MALRMFPSAVDITPILDEVREAKDIASAADAKAVNARQMVLSDRPRLTSLEDVAQRFTTEIARADEIHTAIDAKAQAALTRTMTPGPAGKDGKDGTNGTNGRDGSDATATVVCGGSVAVPALVLGASTDLTIALNATMPNATYRVTTVPGSLLGRVGVVVKARTTTSVTITVTATLAVAVGQSITVICS